MCSTLKNKFPGAHIEKVLGTSQDNQNYISKSGKWKDMGKGMTSIEGPFEEFGECPVERQGKTRSFMDRYGYANYYRVTDYRHPFGTYDGQDVLIFEEFRGSLKHSDMLNYLDGYPLLLPCRCFNRQALDTFLAVAESGNLSGPSSGPEPPRTTPRRSSALVHRFSMDTFNFCEERGVLLLTQERWHNIYL